MIYFLAGAVTFSFLIAAIFFFKFWRSTSDHFFLSFSFAFLLFALNQLATAWIGPADERSGYPYVLRVLGFVLIVVAILMKNVGQRRR